ncbi:MAG: transketolase [Nitrososphaerota archaeon]|nr:transketolase [Nitrososphaerota archaeon]MDG7049048.1 transketolase [Nitrososphaerota archaeon]MDG7052112.1 transketolase [Nitrososphaerota archaeon]
MVSVERLKDISREIGCGIVASTTAAGSGHPGGSLSIKNVMAVLFFHVMRHDPSKPEWPDRDRFVLSKGHAAPALYSTLALAGYIKREELYTLRKLCSRLQGHPSRHPGMMIEASTGALGNGFSMAVGMALAAKIDSRAYRVYTVLGDGEVQEGIVWEAAMLASYRKLDNLIAVVDRNGLQLDGPVEWILSVEPLAAKWRAFGWHVIEADGESVDALVRAFEAAIKMRGRPKVIIAHTTKGESSSVMSWNRKYHGSVLDREQCMQYMKENGCGGWNCR